MIYWILHACACIYRTFQTNYTITLSINAVINQSVLSIYKIDYDVLCVLINIRFVVITYCVETNVSEHKVIYLFVLDACMSPHKSEQQRANYELQSGQNVT